MCFREGLCENKAKFLQSICMGDGFFKSSDTKLGDVILRGAVVGCLGLRASACSEMTIS